MSHWTTVKIEVRDLNALRHALSELKLELRGKGPARYYEGTTEFDAVIPLPGRYDIGLTKTEAGYSLHADWHDNQVAPYVGHEFKKLVQLYGVQKATIEAHKKGLTVTRTVQSNGAIKLAIRGTL